MQYARTGQRISIADEPPHAAAWRLAGACLGTDPDLFFPEGSGLQATRQEQAAKQVCGRCLVRRACLTWALTAPEPDGIWGGTTPPERRQLRNRASAGQPAAAAG